MTTSENRAVLIVVLLWLGSGLGIVLLVGWIFSRASATAAQPQQPVTADVCMLADGRPAYLMVEGSSDGLHVSYIDTSGSIIDKAYRRQAFSSEYYLANTLIVPGAKCAAAKQ